MCDKKLFASEYIRIKDIIIATHFKIQCDYFINMRAKLIFHLL